MRRVLLPGDRQCRTVKEHTEIHRCATEDQETQCPRYGCSRLAGRYRNKAGLCRVTVRSLGTGLLSSAALRRMVPEGVRSRVAVALILLYSIYMRPEMIICRIDFAGW